MKRLFLVLFIALFSVVAFAQSDSELPNNIYGLGAAGSFNATPPVIGIGMYAHKATDNTGTYVVGIFQARPNNTPTFQVTTNVGGGIAQKTVTIANHPVYVMSSIGPSWTGQNFGYNWDNIATVPFRIKKNGQPTDWYLMPFVGVSNSSVDGRTGFQPSLGLIFSWGK